MHSLVIDGWPFYIGLGVLVLHLSFYWLNQWRKYRDRKYKRFDFAATLLLYTLYKKARSMKKEICSLREDIERLTRLPPPEREAPSPPDDSESEYKPVEDESNSSDDPEVSVIKKRYIVRRN
jgi:hypothetical protein